jgi:hypothetical protein
MASMAYSEQVGINLQLGGYTGEIINRYNCINVMKNCFIIQENVLKFSAPNCYELGQNHSQLCSDVRPSFPLVGNLSLEEGCRTSRHDKNTPKEINSIYHTTTSAADG